MKTGITTETIKTLFRPLLTLILLITWIIFLGKGIAYPAAFEYLTIACVGEWVGERFLKRFKELT